MTPLPVRRGDTYEYQCMILDFSKQGVLVLTMPDFVIRLVGEDPTDFGVEATTLLPNTSSLLTTDPLPCNNHCHSNTSTLW